ncbi:MAG: hypothetical protein ACFFCW_20550 [Candidatus Hodarchaeota archaeon]
MDVKLDFQPDKPNSTKGTLIVYSEDESTSLPLCCDKFDIANEKQRGAFIKKLTKEYTGMSAKEVEQAILEYVVRIISERRKAGEKSEDKEDINILEMTPQEIREAAIDTLKNNNLFQQISEDIAAIGVAGEEELALMLYIIMTSRKLIKPLSAIVQGASASGKSFIIETIAKLMPPEEVVQAHDFTDQVFYYMDEGSLQHKIVISGERQHEHRNKDGEAQDNTKAFREMVGSGYLRKAVTIKVRGQLTSKIIEQPGPIAYVESTTATAIHDEDATRLLPLVTDESAEQTQMVMEMQKQEAKGTRIDVAKQQKTTQEHNTMQRLLKTYAVRISYIDSISLPQNNIATRRTFGHLVSVIKAVALLRQYQKDVKHDTDGTEYIKADEKDYRIVYQLLQKILIRTYSPLNQKSRDLLELLMVKTKSDSLVEDSEPFTNQDCQKWAGLSEATVRRRLGPLVWAGIVSVDQSCKPYQYKVEKPELVDSINIGLPDPDDIAERIAIMSV